MIGFCYLQPSRIIKACLLVMIASGMIEGGRIIKASTILQGTKLLTLGSCVNFTGTDHLHRIWNYDLSQAININEPDLSVNQYNLDLPTSTYGQLFQVNTDNDEPPSTYLFNQVEIQNLSDVINVNSAFYKLNSDLTVEPLSWLAANGPTLRAGASLVITKSNKLIIFGGFIKDPNYPVGLLTRQLFLYDFKIKQWKDLTLSCSQGAIPPSAFHSATLINDRFMMILGGAIGSGIADDMPVNLSATIKRNLTVAYVFDIHNETWETKTTLMPNTLPRIAHTATYLPKDNTIVVVGGSNQMDTGLTLYGDSHLLNLTDMSWSPLTFTLPDQKVSTIGRAFHSALLVQDQLFLTFGAYFPGLTKKYDIHIIDINTWCYTNETKEVKINPNFIHFEPEPMTNSNLANDLELAVILGISMGVLVLIFVLTCIYFWFKLKRSKRKFRNVSFLRFDPNPINPALNFDTFYPSSLFEFKSIYSPSIDLPTPRPSNLHYVPIASSLNVDSETTIINPRRWSIDQINPNIKHLEEVPLNALQTRLFSPNSSTIFGTSTFFNAKVKEDI